MRDRAGELFLLVAVRGAKVRPVLEARGRNGPTSRWPPLLTFLWIGLAILASCSRPDQGEKPSAKVSEQAVLIHFDPASAPGGKLEPRGLADLEDQLIAAIDRLGLGEFDGNEFAEDGTSATFYMYGPDAERLFSGIEPVLRIDPRCRNALVEIRRGPPGSAVRAVRI
jgi:hypothetical protein